MMETNFGNMGMQGMFPMLGSQVMTPGAQKGANGLVQTAQTSAFGNLLDLVSDMQVADEQGHGQADFLDDKAQKLFDPESQNLVAASKQLGLMDSLMKMGANSAGPNLGVGRLNVETPAKGNSSETVSVSDLLMNAQGLDTTARTDFTAKVQNNSQNNAESARMWAAALATGDLKSVSVEKEPAFEVEKPLPSALFLRQTAAAGSVEATDLKSLMKPTSTAAKSLVNETSAAPFAALTAKKDAPAKTDSGFEVARPARTDATQSNVVVAAAPKGSRTDGGSSDNADNGAGKGAAFSLKADDSKPKKSVSGGEFLLERSTPGQAPRTAQAVDGAATLGTHGDRRISSESLDFVADKVDALKAQGGGSLKVELNPRDLGSVEIRVTMARGQMKVELSAEKPETLKAFMNSKSDLAVKLDAIAPSKLEMTTLQARPNALSSAAQGNVASTGDLLRMRGAESAKAGPQLVDAKGLTGTASSSRSEGFSSNLDMGSDKSGNRSLGSQERSSDFLSQRERESGQQQGQQRDERRQKALEEWEYFAGHRKSA